MALPLTMENIDYDKYKDAPELIRRTLIKQDAIREWLRSGAKNTGPEFERIKELNITFVNPFKKNLKK